MNVSIIRKWHNLVFQGQTNISRKRNLNKTQHSLSQREMCPLFHLLHYKNVFSARKLKYSWFRRLRLISALCLDLDHVHISSYTLRLNQIKRHRQYNTKLSKVSAEVHTWNFWNVFTGLHSQVYQMNVVAPKKITKSSTSMKDKWQTFLLPCCLLELVEYEKLF